MTPHQRRERELEGLRRLIADCELQITTAATIAPTTMADVFEQHTSLLPDGSRLKEEWTVVADRLRAARIRAVDRARLRSLVAKLQRQADDLELWLTRREARLRGRS